MDLDKKNYEIEDSGLELAAGCFTFSTPAVPIKDDRIIFGSKSLESFANSFQNCDNFNDSLKTSDSIGTFENLILSPIHIPESSSEMNFEFRSPIEYNVSTKGELKFGKNKTSEAILTKSAQGKADFYVEESDATSVSTKEGEGGPVLQKSMFLNGEYQTCFTGYENNPIPFRHSKTVTMNKADLEIIWENVNDSEINKHFDSMNSNALNSNSLTKPSSTENDLVAARDLSAEEAYVSSRSVSFGSSLYESLRNDWKNHWRCNDPPAMAGSGNSSDLENTLNCSTCSESLIETPNLKTQIINSTTLGSEILTPASVGCIEEATCSERAIPNDEFQIFNENQSSSINEVSKNMNIIPGTSAHEPLNEETTLNFETLQITGQNIPNFVIENKCSGQGVTEHMQLYEDCITNGLHLNDQDEELNEEMLKSDTIIDLPQEIEIEASQEIDILSLNPKSDFPLEYDEQLFNVVQDTLPTKDCDSNTTSVYCLHCKRACFENGGQPEKQTELNSEQNVSERKNTVIVSNRLENCEVRLKQQISVLLELFEVDTHVSKAILSALCGDYLISGVNKAEILRYLREKAISTANISELKESINQFFNAAVNAEIVEKKKARYFLGISGDAQNKSDIRENNESSKRKAGCDNDELESEKDLKEKCNVKKRKIAPIEGGKSETAENRNIRSLNTKNRCSKLEISGNLSKTHVKTSNAKVGNVKTVKALLLQKKEVKIKANNLETKKVKSDKDVKVNKLDKGATLRSKTAAKKKIVQEVISKVVSRKMDVKLNVVRKTDAKATDKGKRTVKSSKSRKQEKSKKARQASNVYKMKLRKTSK